MITLFSMLILASSVSLIVSVVMQEGSSGGMGAITGGGSNASVGKSRGSSREEVLKRITIISAVVFIISALVLAAN